MLKTTLAKIVYVTLRPPSGEPAKSDGYIYANDWCWDEKELESAFTSKTRAILINTPNNPLGKVYTCKELEKIAELCIKHNVICVSDEVYEHYTFDNPHIRIGTRHS